MNISFDGKKITGILTVVPKEVSYFKDEIDNFNFPKASSLKLQKLLGLESHRYLKDQNVTGSDLAVTGVRHLLDAGKLKVEDIGALLYVTQTPDYFIPPTSNIIQGVLGLPHDVLCLDINQGCAGFLIGLMQAFMMLPSLGDRKVILINADTASKQTNNKDRNTFPLVGDAVAITVVEQGTNERIWMNLKMDGSRWEALHIPAGGYRLRSNSETAVLQDLGNGNFRSQENIHMDGNAIYNFTMNEVPEMIRDILTQSGKTRDEIDYFVFHQPNKMILQQMSGILEIDAAKMPTETTTIYGNTSSASIPQTICHYLKDQITSSNLELCIAGFGVGLTWSSMVLPCGPLSFCEMIEF